MGNAASIMSEIILKNEIIVDGKEMMQKIISEQTVEKLFQIIKQGVRTSFSQINLQDNLMINNACNMLYSIICVYMPMGYTPDPLGIEEPTYDEEKLKEDPIIKHTLEGLETFAEILKRDPEEENIKTSYGASVKPLGSGRLRILDIIERVIRIKSRYIYTKFRDLDLLKIITVRK